MPLRNQLNQLKGKLESLNRQHNILPFGQGQGSQSQHQYPYQQQYQQPQQPYYGPPPPQQYYPPPPSDYNTQTHNPYAFQPGYAPPPPDPQYAQQYPGQAPQSPYQHSNQQPPYDPTFHSPTSTYDRPPPPVPQHSHPGAQSAQQQPNNKRYWTARFDLSTPISHEWEHQEGNNNGWGNAELENYTRNPENSFCTSDNKLIIRAISNNGNHTSARLVSRQTLSRNRGCLTTFLNLPCARGIWPAFWLLPREPSTWPHEGEIDIAEAWNAECENHACLHWGHYTPEDNWKHRVKTTPVSDMPQRAVRYDFVWHETGRLLWYVDNRAVMKANMPHGTRRIEDWCVIMNVAMGGNVCKGEIPQNGAYDMVVHTVYMSEEPELGGWGRFEADWQQCPEGNTL